MQNPAASRREGADVDFWDLTKLMFRRWYVSVPAFLMAIGATLYAAAQVEPDYVATSYVQLVPPAVTPKATDDTKATARNPWLDLGLASLTKAGMISVQDQRVVKELERAGFSDDFTLTQDAQLPIVTFEVIGDDEAQATQTSEQLVKRFDRSVATLQKEYGAPGEQMITARRLDLGDNVEESTSKVKRALIAVAGVGVLLALALTVAVDALLRRRGRGKREDAAPEPGEQLAPAPAPAPDQAPPVVPAPAVVPKPRTPAGGPRQGVQYTSQSARTENSPEQTAVIPASPGEKTAVLRVTPGEETIVLPPPKGQSRNGRANGSKRP